MRNAAVSVDNVLAGARPAELPMPRPTKTGLVIRSGTARRPGVTIPTALLLRADGMIE